MVQKIGIRNVEIITLLAAPETTVLEIKVRLSLTQSTTIMMITMIAGDMPRSMQVTIPMPVFSRKHYGIAVRFWVKFSRSGYAECEHKKGQR